MKPTTTTTRTGLTALLRRGWSLSSDALLRLRLTRGPMDTGWHNEERAVCDAARKLEKDYAHNR